MSEESKKDVNPYPLIALFSGGASAGIAVICIFHFSTISDSEMWAIAAMVGAPAIMGIGVAYFMSKQTPRQ